MRRLAWGIALLAALCAVAPASANTVAFASSRCDDAEDYEQRRAAFITSDAAHPRCRQAIWLIEDDGTGLRRITDGGEGILGSDWAPAWSPDGRRIAYTSSETVYVVDRSGGNRRELGPGNNPSWTPDGLGVVVSGLAPEDPGTVARDLHVIWLNGLVRRRLTNTPEDELDPDLSPDGRRIVFNRFVSVPQRLAFAGSPDAAVFGPEPPDARKGSYSLSLPDLQEQPLVQTDLEGTFNPSFSPDGSKIGLMVRSGIHVLNADGSGIRRFSEEATNSVDWIGEDTLMVGENRADNSYPLMKLALDGSGRKVPLTPATTDASDQQPDWDASVAGSAPVVDSEPPVVEVIDGASGAAAASLTQTAARRRTIRRGNLRYIAADASGVRSVRVAFGLRSRGRCRYLGRRGYSRPRRCSRPLYRKVSGTRSWRRLTGRLRPGRYVILTRSRDGRGRASGKPSKRHLRIRR